MKLIRECRFGQPKTYKTGTVVSTYPKPMVVFEFDRGGLTTLTEGYGMKVAFVTVEQFRTLAGYAPADLPPVTAIDFSQYGPTRMDTDYAPIKDAVTFTKAVEAVNILATLKTCPWQTGVLDTVTELSNAIWRHESEVNPKVLVDARKWAGNIGMKVKQVIDVLHLAKCHMVTIMHSTFDKNEQGQILQEQPMVYSNLRDYITALFEQVLYHGHDGTRAYVRTRAFGYVHGIGCRWPLHLPDPVPIGGFKELYGGVDFSGNEPAS